jgi:DNA polymerase-3 subunit epsilon
MIAASLDIETTGFCEPEHRIVEIRIDLLNVEQRKAIWSYEQRINPLRNMPADAQRVHGISGAELSDKPAWEQIGPVVKKILDKADFLVIHNAEFDANFLNMEFQRIGLPKMTQPSFCTMENGIWAAPTGKKPSLQELCFACGIEYDPALAHAAAYDVDCMSQCFFKGLDWGFFQSPEPAAPAQAV